MTTGKPRGIVLHGCGSNIGTQNGTNQLKPDFHQHQQGINNNTRSSSREVRTRVRRFFLFVYFSRGTLPTKKGERRALLGDLGGLVFAGGGGGGRQM